MHPPPPKHAWGARPDIGPHLYKLAEYNPTFRLLIQFREAQIAREAQETKAQENKVVRKLDFGE